MSEHPPKIINSELSKSADFTKPDMPSWLSGVRQQFEERQKREVLGTEREYQNEQWKKWEAKYAERRKHSETVDDGKDSALRGDDKEWHTQSEIGSSDYLVQEMLEASDYFRYMLAGRPLADVGSGDRGFENALAITGHKLESETRTIREGTEFDFGIAKVVLVDPSGESNVEDAWVTEDYLHRQDVTDEERADVKNRIEFKRQGGESYLLEQPAGSTNIMCGSLDESIIPIQDAQRIAQEIFRVVPEDGFFISVLSEDIEAEARKLFPYSLETTYHTYLFSKSPLPTLDGLDRLKKEQRYRKEDLKTNINPPGK